MTNTEKMTYVKALDYVLDKCTLPEEVREKLENLHDQTAKRNSAKSGKPTAKQVESANLADALYGIMVASSGEALTVSDWMVKGEPFKSMTNQKVAAIIRLLENTGRVERIPDKRKTLFKAI